MINKYKEARFREELIVMETDSHYYPSCCLKPWDRRGLISPCAVLLSEADSGGGDKGCDK